MAMDVMKPLSSKELFLFASTASRNIFISTCALSATAMESTLTAAGIPTLRITACCCKI